MNDNSRTIKLAIIAIVLAFFLASLFRYAGSLKKDEPSENTTYSRVQYDRFSFEVGDDWNTADDSGYTYYIVPDGRYMFTISNITSDFGISAEENFDAIIDSLDCEVQSGLSEIKLDRNGIPYKTASLLTTINNASVVVQVVMCEEKNLIFYFLARCSKEKYIDSASEELNRMCDSIEFKDTPDMVTGRTFYMDMEKLTAELHSDGTFLLYQDKNDIDSAHISGTYDVYRGGSAVKKVDSMTEYGLTADEQKRIINNSVEFWDDYYAVVFYANEVVQDGESIETGSTILYVGYADKDHKSLAMTSCNRFINEVWTYSE